MKAAWVTVYNAEDPDAYETRGYYEPRSLRDQSVAIDYVGSLQTPKLFNPLFKVKRRLNRSWFVKPGDRGWYSHQRSPLLFKEYARQISRRLSKLNDVDIVCSGPSYCSQPVAYLECDQPIVIWTDGTFADTLDFYPEYYRNRICRESIEDGLANEKAALGRSKLLIYASEWAAQSAVKHYPIDPSKIRIVPWGANFECNHTLEDIRRIVDARPVDGCKLLFFGFDWRRKRGDFAIQVAQDLNNAGLKTELTIVSNQPQSDKPFPDFVRFLGPIRKTKGEDLNRLFKLLAESHFMILPTLADASPYALSEAAAFGLPALTTNVGGIPTIIKDGLNGKKFSLDASSEAYCTYVSNLFSNYSQYQSLALSSFHEYESRLNWSVAGRTVKKLLAELVHG